MRNKLIIISVILLTILLAFDVYFMFSKQNSNCLSERINQKNIDIKIFQNQVSKYYSNELLNIKNCKLYLNNKPLILSNKFFDKPVLVFRFSIFNCSECVHFALNKLKQNLHDFATNDRIILIYDDNNMRVSESMFGKMPYVTKERNIMGIPMENSNIPFMFILDTEMKVKHFFIPEKGMPELTDEYLSIIKTRYFNTKKKE